MRLILENEGASGWRHYLGGKPVRNGVGLDLLTPNGWVSGRYETQQGTDGRPVPRFHMPILFWHDLAIAKMAGGPTVAMDLPEFAVLRWPSSEEAMPEVVEVRECDCGAWFQQRKFEVDCAECVGQR